MSAREFRDLGRHRRIPRRDFLNGLAVGLTAAGLEGRTPRLAAEAQAPVGGRAYLPQRLGQRGQHASAIAADGAMKGGAAAAYPPIDAATGGFYDLVIAVRYRS